MKDLEKDLNESCGCCEECNCGDNCSCTPDNKCCDNCTCDANCSCHDEEKDCCDGECECCEEKEACQNDKIEADCTEQCEFKDQENNVCECNSQDDSCNCSENCTCGDDCGCDEDNKCCDECTCGEDKEDDNPNDDDKCKCGCGEKVEENASDAYFKQLLSLQAEFDNYRKRTQGDISKAYQNGFNEAITQFIPALDSFKMATEYITDQNTLMGIQYIEKGILATLEKMGIEVIDVSGKFDPNFHQAIGSEVSTNHESGDIIKECFKGFKMGDKVIRYAQVIVAK